MASVTPLVGLSLRGATRGGSGAWALPREACSNNVHAMREYIQEPDPTYAVVSSSRGSHWNNTETASVKLFVPPASRYHAWKPYVSPGCTGTGGLIGIKLRSICSEKLGP